VEAEAKFAEADFDLAVLDLCMPEIDGLELLSSLKRRRPLTSVIMLSGEGSTEAAVRCLHAGAYDFLQKPCHGDRLVQTLNRALNHNRLRDAGARIHASQEILAARDAQSMPELVVRKATEILAADAAALLLPDMHGVLQVSYSVGLSPEQCEQTTARSTDGLIRTISSSVSPAILCGWPCDGAQPVTLQSSSEEGSSLIFPMLAGTRFVGLLMFLRAKDAVPFRWTDVDTASLLASHLVLALENSRLIQHAATTDKLAAVGELASGIAHEINSPMQFLGDSIEFLSEAFEELSGILESCQALCQSAEQGKLAPGLVDALVERVAASALPMLMEEIPRAVCRSKTGVERVATIVRAVKNFGHPGTREKFATNINDAIGDTLTVARNAYKYVADVTTELGKLPLVVCLGGEMNQVFLNLIINAAHAIESVVGTSGRRGSILIRTVVEAGGVLIQIEDTGGGIPVEVQARIFDPFYTTKEVGKGTGLGLSLARSIVVEKHGGTLDFETTPGKGTRFSVRLPLNGAP